MPRRRDRPAGGARPRAAPRRARARRRRSTSGRASRSTRGPADGRPVRLTTPRPRAPALLADQVVVATNAWAAGWRPFGRRLVTWSSYIVLTEPIPDRLAEIGWTGGEGIADSRFTLHYGRTTRRRPDRARRRRRPGRAAAAGSGGRSPTTRAAARRAAEGLRRWFPSLADVRIEDAWGGPIDITDDHRPWFGTLPGGRIHFGLGYSRQRRRAVDPRRADPRGAGAGPGADDDAASLPIVGDATPRAFPPEPFRCVGARVFREAIVRREAAEEAGRPPDRLAAAISRIPRRLGYHLGPDVIASATAAD